MYVQRRYLKFNGQAARQGFHKTTKLALTIVHLIRQYKPNVEYTTKREKELHLERDRFAWELQIKSLHFAWELPGGYSKT